jgi:hypothetical protein
MALPPGHPPGTFNRFFELFPSGAKGHGACQRSENRVRPAQEATEPRAICSTHKSKHARSQGAKLHLKWPTGEAVLPELRGTVSLGDFGPQLFGQAVQVVLGVNPRRTNIV